MANPEHLKILKQGAGIWNAWRNEHKTGRIYLSNVCNACVRARPLRPPLTMEVSERA
jgi:hypothetical protein